MVSGGLSEKAKSLRTQKLRRSQWGMGKGFRLRHDMCRHGH